MHHVGVAQDLVEGFHLHRAELRDPADVVAAKVDEHVVLGKLLFIPEKSLLEGSVLLRGLAPGSCPRKREGVKDAVVELYQGLRGGTCHLHIRAREVKHVRGGIEGPEDPVGVQQAPLKVRIHAV